ncbi:MAG: FtsW/RodA/SpoVE family cell cycle protein [Fimbriimonas sp.]|nr:FtsW/RodA/SpoVE family cell cycle protein [Fimbriimonas sp.]
MEKKIVHVGQVSGLSRLSGYGNEQRRVPKVDWLLVCATLLLITIGLMSLFSEGYSHDGGANFRKQVVDTLIGVVPFCLFAFTTPLFWRRCVNLIYGLNIATLLAVFVIGAHRKGAERWIQMGPLQFQPSEMAKILTVLTLSAYYANRQSEIQKPSTFWLGFLHVAVPFLLVLMQPHLGAALVILVCWAAISIVAGVPAKYFAIFAILFLALGGALALSGKLLHGYQMERVLGIFSHDAKGKSYQTDQAEIAFGMGGVTGSGFLHGERKAGHFIPEQHDDFIFTVMGEEGGLIGCSLVLVAYAFFFYRLWLVMFQATDPYYKMIVGGLFAALSFHTFVNIAMVLHMLPVVGLWLPFLSYGGTAMWMCMSSVGLALNIRRRERPLLF